jgi:hypothetical protein
MTKKTSDTPTPIHAYNDRDEKGRKLALVYECREKWDNLHRTDNDQVRYCTNCSQPVFQVSDVNDFERAVATKQCIMVKPPDHSKTLMGVVVMKYEPPSLLKWED